LWCEGKKDGKHSRWLPLRGFLVQRAEGKQINGPNKTEKIVKEGAKKGGEWSTPTTDKVPKGIKGKTKTTCEWICFVMPQ